jgi:hypothetical protein
MMHNGRVATIVILGLLFSVLVGCSSFSESNLTKAKAGYITNINDKSILVNDIVFSARTDIEVVSDAGEEMKFSDLQIGMLVEPWFDGGIRESFPAQADVKKIVVLTEKDSVVLQNAVKAVVEYAAAHYGKTVVFQETEVSDEYFQAIIAGVTLENPNPVTLRYDFVTQHVLEQ